MRQRQCNQTHSWQLRVPVPVTQGALRQREGMADFRNPIGDMTVTKAVCPLPVNEPGARQPPDSALKLESHSTTTLHASPTRSAATPWQPTHAPPTICTEHLLHCFSAPGIMAHSFEACFNAASWGHRWHLCSPETTAIAWIEAAQAGCSSHARGGSPARHMCPRSVCSAAKRTSNRAMRVRMVHVCMQTRLHAVAPHVASMFL